LEEFLNPSPVKVTFVLPVKGPNFGLMENIAYGGPVMVDMFNDHISPNQLLDHPP